MIDFSPKPIINNCNCDSLVNKATYNCRGCSFYSEEHDMGASIPICNSVTACKKVRLQE